MVSLRLVTLESATDEERHTPGDDMLMMLAAAGQTRAFAALVERHEARVRSFCTLVLGDAGLARDAAQSVLLRLWTTRKRYRATGKFRELLFTIARNECRSLRRRRKWARLFTPLLEADTRAAHQALNVPARECSALELLATEERHAAVRAALDSLPEKFRVPLALRFVEALDYDAIARVIGRTPSAARSRVHYGLKALAAMLPEEVVE